MGADVARRSARLLYLPVSTPSNDFTAPTGRAPICSASRSSVWTPRQARGSGTSKSCITDVGLRPGVCAGARDVTIDGRRVDIVAQLTKQGFVFVFDRVTGGPSGRSRNDRCRPATWSASKSPRSSLSDEAVAIAPQGVTLDDAFDLTPD
jgi:quinoprotein glucose dehydrogenase